MVLEVEAKTKDTIYVPDIATITDTKDLTPTEKQFTIRVDDPEKRKAFTFEPGQFVEVTVYGLGEAPFSIPSSPNNSEGFELCVRNIGNVSNALHRMQPGDKIGVRGPFGKGYFPKARLFRAA